MTTHTIHNGEQILDGIYAGGKLRDKLGLTIEPTAIDKEGNLVPNPWFQGGKVVKSNRPGTTPTVLWTVSKFAPRSEYISFEVELLGNAMRKSRFHVEHAFFERVANPQNKRHSLKALFVIPRESTVKVWLTDRDGNRLSLFAELANVDGKPVVTMFGTQEAAAETAK